MLVATPAFGIGGLLLDLIGRTNVPFTRGKSAPLEIKRDFFDLSLHASPRMAPQAMASQARRVGVFHVRGRERVLYVAPTRRGGYCFIFTDAFGGCRPTRTPPRPARAQPGAVRPFLLGLTWQGSPSRFDLQGRPRDRRPPYTTQVGGDILTATAHTLQVEYENGETTPISFIFVSKPIAAGFFLYAIPRGHEQPGTRVRAVSVLDLQGHVLARQPISYAPPPRRPLPLPPRNVGPPVRRSPALPPPKPPLQRGEAGGVIVTAGRNGVAVFDTSNAAPRVRKLIAGRAVGYACFSYMRYHRDAPAELGFSRTMLPRVAIRTFGLRTPFDGCEIQGGYGHRWPDRNRSHSAVEIAFTDRGRRFFADRAAARDLALFVRSRNMHEIRKLKGYSLRTALRRRYGDAIDELPSTTAPLPPRRIGYVIRPDGVTFVERSTTGRRFSVVITRGRIARQNVKPLGFVF
ncbi:MAG: hypothetical protein H0U00_07225 [Actinobacteria bacterium]|nr:hypothetical protein [Actinomycetota bacterium]